VYAWEALKRELEPIKPEADLGKFVMRTTRSLISKLRLLRQCLLLGFLLTPVMAVGQNFEDTLRRAEGGNAIAQYDLGVMYDLGESVSEDDAEAVKWYRLAAEQGHVSAQYNLAVMYDNGEGVPQDDAEAVKWYRLAAEQGHVSAQFNLAVMYANGWGVSSNTVTAYAWLDIAAASRNENAISAQSIVEQHMTPSQIAEAQQLSTEIFERIQQGNR
jgi:TPR repeat protein